MAVTGASGSVYAELLMRQLLSHPDLTELALIFSDNGRAVAEYEGAAGLFEPYDARVKVFDNHDMFAPPASGSAGYDSMVIIPCSMGTVGRIAHGISGDLISRAADVMLKERRKLVVVPRETPMSTIHLRNLTALSECGAVIVPACPSFYSHPATIEELCRTVTDRACEHLGFPADGYHWQGGERAK